MVLAGAVSGFVPVSGSRYVLVSANKLGSPDDRCPDRVRDGTYLVADPAIALAENRTASAHSLNGNTAPLHGCLSRTSDGLG